MSNPEPELLFSLPPDGPDRVAIWRKTERLENSSVFEIFYVLDVIHHGQVQSFRLPHDMEKLWDILEVGSQVSTPET